MLIQHVLCLLAVELSGVSSWFPVRTYQPGSVELDGCGKVPGDIIFTNTAYLHRTLQNWTIVVGDGFSVLLEFVRFQLVHSEHCSTMTVNIFFDDVLQDGPFCGNHIPEGPFVVSGSRLTIAFRSERYVGRHQIGFHAKYQRVSTCKGRCSQKKDDSETCQCDPECLWRKDCCLHYNQTCIDQPPIRNGIKPALKAKEPCRNQEGKTIWLQRLLTRSSYHQHHQQRHKLQFFLLFSGGEIVQNSTSGVFDLIVRFGHEKVLRYTCVAVFHNHESLPSNEVHVVKRTCREVDCHKGTCYQRGCDVRCRCPPSHSGDYCEKVQEQVPKARWGFKSFFRLILPKLRHAKRGRRSTDGHYRLPDEGNRETVDNHALL
ncbi:uncharacterized protein LOC143275791 [Babylonia areolata]|uniref:uncharacterized protein LOC143275791 n=1 Tax=Babylonia areolata TaxID=304850 RepID=UPI003FCFA836